MEDKSMKTGVEEIKTLIGTLVQRCVLIGCDGV